jgi:hypothetical protein
VSDSNQRILAIVVTVLLALIGAIQAAGALSLGLSPQTLAWLGVLVIPLSVLLGFLPRVNQPTEKPPA